jgi:hypothetical protein
MAEASPLREQLGIYQRRALLVGAGATLLALLGLLLNVQQFMRSYLAVYIFVIAFPLGSLAVMQLNRITGGAWGFPVRRLLEAATRTLPLMALLFVPIALGAQHLYPWTHADAVAADPVLLHKSAYLSLNFWLLRAAICFALWITAAYVQDRLTAAQDINPSRERAHRMRTLAAPGLMLWGLAVTVASVDWVMSLEPHWYSSLYGPIFMIGQGLTAFAFAVLVAAWLSSREPFSRWINAGHVHDLGKLLFTFVLLWAYVEFSQFLLIWYANLEEEAPWYLRRIRSGWLHVTVALVALHFALPFLVLLSRRVKRDVRKLAWIAGALLVTRYLDALWRVKPAFQLTGFPLHWLDLVLPLAMGGLWFAYFISRVKGRPLVALQDARLEAELEPRSPLTEGPVH